MKRFEPGNLLVKKWKNVCLGWPSLDVNDVFELNQYDVSRTIKTWYDLRRERINQVLY